MPLKQPYAYTNSAWKDQLTSYDGESITYDASGNPTNYLGAALVWEGQRLKSYTPKDASSGRANSYVYSYDENGIRTRKTIGSTVTDYYYNGTLLMGTVKTTTHSDGSTTTSKLRFSYDANGKVVAVNYNGNYYYYLRNAQSDIVKLIDKTGATVVEYRYDSWGKLLSTSGSLASTLGKNNPFRYRGYVYDEETGFYYLQSRYYNPEVGRFISSDVLLSTGQGVLGHNAYAYCGNNPVNRIDPSGQFWITALIVTAVVAVCTVTFSGCSAQPASDVGAAKPYINMPGSNDPSSPNCYAYAIGSPFNEQPGRASGRFPTKWNDVNDVGESVKADLEAMGRTVRKISGPDAKVYDNEFKIALRVGTRPYKYNLATGQVYYDYHFMRQTDTGQWAEKHGYGGASVLWGAGMTPDTIPWTLCGVPYYDSAIIYYAVGN